LKRENGYALITALLATAIIAVIALILVSATVRGLRDTRASGERLTLLQKAENAAEFARMQVLQVYRCNQRQYTVGQFFGALENGQTLSCSHPPVRLKLGETRSLALYPGTELKWQLKATHLEGGFAWAEVVATAKQGNRRQTVIERYR
jgi:Tfp pilus assembly protein PilV